MRESLRQRDYHKYKWKRGELVMALLFSAGVTVFLAGFFYRSALAMIPLTAVGVAEFYRIRVKKAEAERKELVLQFRECILAVSAALRAGYAVENAFLECRQDMLLMYGEQSNICRELDYMRRGLAINITLEELLADFGERSGCQEVRQFAQIFALAKRNGGSMPEIIRSTAAMIGQKIDLQQEIDTMLSGRRMEQNVMKLMPFGILLYIGVTNPGYFDTLYHNPQGVLLMTGCLCVYLLAYALGDRIMKGIAAETG